MGREDGFTLVELLVVMLILGILAAIAIPTFFNQRDKAQDAEAKSNVRTAETAMETFATDNGGDYTPGAMTDAQIVTELEGIEGVLDATALTVDTSATAPSGAAAVYSLTYNSDVGGQTFSIFKLGNGNKEFDCTVEGDAGCPTGGNWGQE
jgi:type IV pilus assembly protein PilA